MRTNQAEQPENLDRLASFLRVPREIATEADWETARAHRARVNRDKKAARKANQRREAREALLRGDRWV